MLQKPAGVVGEVSLQSNPVKREILPEGQSGGILDFYSLSVYLQAQNTCQGLTQWYPTYYSQCRSCIVSRWQMVHGDERDALRSQGPEWEDCCCHFWSDAHHSVLIIAAGWIRNPASFIIWSFSFLAFSSQYPSLPHVIICHNHGLFSRWFISSTLLISLPLPFVHFNFCFVYLSLCSLRHHSAFVIARLPRRAFPPSCHSAPSAKDCIGTVCVSAPVWPFRRVPFM